MRSRNEYTKNFSKKTRELYYSDYGISKEEKEAYLKEFRSDNVEVSKLLLCSCQKANKEMYKLIYLSLCFGLSYERIEYLIDEIPMAKIDFYAYQRLTVYIYSRLSKMK